MHRLSHFKHKVVCQVCKEIDRSHTAVIKTDPHICRTDFSCDILKLKTGISVTEGIFDLHIYLRKILVFGKIDGIKRLERSACKSGKLPCNSVVSPEVGTVGKRLVIDLKNDIVNFHNVLDIRAVGKALIKLHNARMVIADTDLFF